CSFHVHRILGRELYTKSVRTASVNERIKSILQSSRTSVERGPRSAKTLRLRTIARNTRTLSRKETQSLDHRHVPPSRVAPSPPAKRLPCAWRCAKCDRKDRPPFPCGRHRICPAMLPSPWRLNRLRD